MVDETRHEAEPDVTPLTGQAALDSARALEDSYEALTRSLLASGELSRKKELYDHIGTALSLLSQIASCHWGCRGGDHVVENMVRRFCNYGLAAVRLSFFGFYDEALGLVRGMSEIVNLLHLFALDPNEFAEWNRLPDTQRRNRFKPVKVRERITKKGAEPPVNEATYSQLCEIGIHVTPVSLVLSHNVGERVYVGAHFSSTAVTLVLNQLERVLAPCLSCVGGLVGASSHRLEQLVSCQSSLEKSVGRITVDNYERFWSSLRKSAVDRYISEKLDVMTEDEWKQLGCQIVQGQIASGAIPAEGPYSDEEVDLVNKSISVEIHKRFFNTWHYQEAQKIEVMARLAIAEQAAIDAETYKLSQEHDEKINE